MRGSGSVWTNLGTPSRDALIIRLRMGLDDDEPYTLDAVGKVLGVTRERVRQLEGKARSKFVAALVTRGLIPVRRQTAPVNADEHVKEEPEEPPQEDDP